MSGHLVLLVGAHRSGTSVLAHSLLQRYAWSASRHAVPSNPSGQWERTEMRPSLELLLALNGATWAQPPAPDRLLNAGPWEGALVRGALRRLERPGLWKDPRLCLTVDYWLDRLAELEPRVILIHREPLDVARSLQRRNGFTIEQGLALWERTVQNALARLRGHDVISVSYQAFTRGPDSTLAAIDDFLGISADVVRASSSLGVISQARTAELPSSSGYGDAVAALCPSAALLSDLHEVVGQLPPPPPEPRRVPVLLGKANRRRRLRAVIRGLRVARGSD